MSEESHTSSEKPKCLRCQRTTPKMEPCKFKTKRYQCDISIKGFLCEDCVTLAFGFER